MKKIALLGILLLISVSFAESYRLMDTPRCKVDVDLSNNIVDVSKCPIAQDQFYGDSTFSIAIACHDTKASSDMETVKIYPKSLHETEDEDDSYLEITPQTNYSFRIGYVYRIPQKDEVIFSAETFYNWVREGRIDWCRLWLGSPHGVKRIYK